MTVYDSLTDLQRDLFAGKFSTIDWVNQHIARIEEKDKEYNAFVEIFYQEARDRATVLDQKIKFGKPGKLAGLIVGIKDNICYKGMGLSAGSKMLKNFESLFSATVVERLLAEDAIIIGRLNCDEFAMGSSNETSYYGAVKNPLDTTKVPGGSSGGSAAAVAAGFCQIALGSDTGGSIRQPASFTGTVGLKPTYGRVSRHGLIAFASSFDQIGPIGRSVEDVAAVTEIISGADQYDSTASTKEVPAFSEIILQDNIPTYKIAVLRDCIENEGVDEEIRLHLKQKITELKEAGHQVEMVEFPYFDYLVPIYYLIATAEASSNLARYDGVHFGHRSENATDLESIYKLSRAEGFGTEVKRRIILGTFVLSSGYYDAYYGSAQKARRFISNKMQDILKDYDFMLSPTSPSTAFGIGIERDNPVQMYLEDIFTVMANISGAPSISIPTGNHSNGLPFGIQFTGRHFGEADLLNLSHQILKK
jgi:aspartyl-tRNA(Asn)/glutamyl-tRNA(Gln) amidotransferase subunit A